MPFIKGIAKRFKNRGADENDLIQSGALGLIEAYGSFDESLGTAFTTYAFKFVEGAMRAFIRKNRMVLIPRNELESAFELKRAYDELTAIKGDLSFSSAADELGVTVDELKKKLLLVEPCLPLSKTDEDGKEEECGMQALFTASFEEEKIDKMFLKEAINRLNEHEKKVLIRRYINDETQTEVACRLGLSQSKVSKTEKLAIKKLAFMLQNQI